MGSNALFMSQILHYDNVNKKIQNSKECLDKNKNQSDCDIIYQNNQMPFQLKEERAHVKSRKPLSSSTNTRDSVSHKQKSHAKKENASTIIGQTFAANRSITGIRSRNEVEEHIKAKDAFMDKVYDKYYKKQRKQQFPNISIIEEKDSILSINQQNSLDSLNNFIIQGNRHQSSVLQKSNQQSSYQSSAIEDWTLLQNQYQHIFEQNYERCQENQYFEVINQIKDKQQKNHQNVQENVSPIFTVTQKIKNLKEQIEKLKTLQKSKSKNQESSEVLENIAASQSYNHQKSSMFNEKSLEQKNSNRDILRKSQTTIQLQQSVKSKISKMKIKISEDFNKKEQISDRLLQHLSEEETKFVEEESPSANYEETEKDQQQFMKYMDKKYSEDNQPNLSLNNISKIMGVRPKEHHNKSIENQTQIKEKEDDQMVAMLQNELREKEIPEIPETQQTQILLKESRDNLCLNDLEGDIQNNIQTAQIQEQVSDENKKNFFIALEARQKWIKSLQKDEKWKNAQLALLSKMKKILHNPYIQFSED